MGVFGNCLCSHKLSAQSMCLFHQISRLLFCKLIRYLYNFWTDWKPTQISLFMIGNQLKLKTNAPRSNRTTQFVSCLRRAIFRWITLKDLNVMKFDETVRDQDTPLGLLRGIKYGTETYHTLFLRLCRLGLRSSDSAG